MTIIFLDRKQCQTEEGEQLSPIWQSINKISTEENPVDPSGSKKKKIYLKMRKHLQM